MDHLFEAGGYFAGGVGGGINLVSNTVPVSSYATIVLTIEEDGGECFTQIIFSACPSIATVARGEVDVAKCNVCNIKLDYSAFCVHFHIFRSEIRRYEAAGTIFICSVIGDNFKR